jgi:hypothetical protein
LPAGSNKISVGSGGILSPGDLSGDYTAGTLLLATSVSSLTLSAGSTFEVDISSSANDMVQALRTAGATLDIEGGTIVLNYLDSFVPEVGESWLLTSGFNATAGLADNMTVSDALGYTYSLSFENNNLMLTLDAVPEPATYLLLGVGAAILLVGCRLRRQIL